MNRLPPPPKEWRCPKCKMLHGYYPAAGACATKGCNGRVESVVPSPGAQSSR